jgi:hypothetical protein
MAAITPVAASVATVDNSSMVDTTHQYGETVGIFKAVYLNASDSKWYLADSNDAAKYKATGISLAGGIASSKAVVLTKGQVESGATTVKGTAYCVGNAGGGTIVPQADLAAGDYVQILAIGVNTTGRLFVAPCTTDVLL